MVYTNIRYSTTLNDAQLDYLSDECQDINRMMCFKTFLRLAVLDQTKVTRKHFSAVLQPGQFMMPVGLVYESEDGQERLLCQ